MHESLAVVVDPITKPKLANFCRGIFIELPERSDYILLNKKLLFAFYYCNIINIY